MSLEQSFPAAAASVPAARRFVRQALGGLSKHTLDALELIVSELATNCVVHAGSAFRLRVDTQPSLRQVRVEVTDTGSGEAHMRSPSTTEAHGRGLRIVDTLADEWGVVRSATGVGKTVWFAFDLPTSVTLPGSAAHREQAQAAHPTVTEPLHEQQRTGINDGGAPDEHVPRACCHPQRRRLLPPCPRRVTHTARGYLCLRVGSRRPCFPWRLEPVEALQRKSKPRRHGQGQRSSGAVPQRRYVTNLIIHRTMAPERLGPHRPLPICSWRSLASADHRGELTLALEVQQPSTATGPDPCDLGRPKTPLNASNDPG
jgi:anti-sigma regulatory factor (Ser/Thr protein kinase)